MELSYETFMAIQGGFVIFMLLTFEDGAKDPFGFGMRNAAAIIYSLFMLGDQRAYGTIFDWVAQTMCLCQFISLATHLVSPTFWIRRKDG
jgi:hypothetical protein